MTAGEARAINPESNSHANDNEMLVDASTAPPGSSRDNEEDETTTTTWDEVPPSLGDSAADGRTTGTGFFSTEAVGTTIGGEHSRSGEDEPSTTHSTSREFQGTEHDLETTSFFSTAGCRFQSIRSNLRNEYIHSLII